MLTFRTHLDGFTNRDLRQLTAELRGLDPAAVTTGQTSYDLRRLRSHGLIERRPHSHRYRVTDQGLQTAMFLTRVHDRLLPTGLVLAQQADPHTPHPQRAKRAGMHWTIAGLDPVLALRTLHQSGHHDLLWPEPQT